MIPPIAALVVAGRAGRRILRVLCRSRLGSQQTLYVRHCCGALVGTASMPLSGLLSHSWRHKEEPSCWQEAFANPPPHSDAFPMPFRHVWWVLFATLLGSCLGYLMRNSDGIDERFVLSQHIIRRVGVTQVLAMALLVVLHMICH